MRSVVVAWAAPVNNAITLHAPNAKDAKRKAVRLRHRGAEVAIRFIPGAGVNSATWRQTPNCEDLLALLRGEGRSLAKPEAWFF